MEVIRDKDGNIIQRSKNLAGIHRYVGTHAINLLSISRIGQGEGKLCISFEDGSSFESNWPTFSALLLHVRNWRNVYGAPLSVNGGWCGKVGRDNPALNPGFHPDLAYIKAMQAMDEPRNS